MNIRWKESAWFPDIILQSYSYRGLRLLLHNRSVPSVHILTGIYVFSKRNYSHKRSQSLLWRQLLCHRQFSQRLRRHALIIPESNHRYDIPSLLHQILIHTTVWSCASSGIIIRNGFIGRRGPSLAQLRPRRPFHHTASPGFPIVCKALPLILLIMWTRLALIFLVHDSSILRTSTS